MEPPDREMRELREGYDDPLDSSVGRELESVENCVERGTLA